MGGPEKRKYRAAGGRLADGAGDRCGAIVAVKLDRVTALPGMVPA